MTRATDRRTLVTRHGKTLPFTLLGYGSGPLGNFRHALDEGECDRTIEAAWRNGVRYFDTSPLYGLGLSEVRVGRVLRQLPRGDFVISTKVGRVLVPCEEGEQNVPLFVKTPPNRVEFDYSYDGVMRSFESSLTRLGLERVDILYAHDLDAIVHGGRDISEARIRELFDLGGWRAMDELRSAGVVTAIGAGVNEWQPCVRLLELADPDLFLLAGRYTLLEQPPAEAFFPKLAASGARVVIGGPYNSGVLAGKDTYDYADVPPHVAVRVRALRAACDERGVNLRAAALQFVAAHPHVMSVIPGAITAAEVADNVEALATPIPADFWRALKDQGLLALKTITP